MILNSFSRAEFSYFSEIRHVSTDGKHFRKPHKFKSFYLSTSLATDFVVR